MTIGQRLRLREGVHAATDESTGKHLILWPHTDRLGMLTSTQQTVLHRLTGDPRTPDELSHGVPEPAEAAQLVDRLRAGGWLRVTVTEQDEPLYTLEPLRPARPHHDACTEPWAMLSRFAALTPDGEHLVLGVPGGNCDVRLHDPRALATVNALTGGASVRQLAEILDEHAVRHMLADLAFAGVLDEEAGSTPDELRSRQWSPHELWFHTRSRLGSRRRLGEHFGKTTRFEGIAPQPPPEREPFDGPKVKLARPDLDTLRDTDIPFTALLEDRRSIRVYDDDHPLTVEQLGEFLYRCTSTRQKTSPEGVAYLGRPYPSGGASYELEFYPLVHNVDGLASGLYRYDQAAHQLESIEASAAALHRMTGVLKTLQDMPEPPQVLIIISARFGRVMWKYEAMAYALILKHVGVVYQVMYLVATAMGLSPCAVGTGDSDEFSSAIGTDLRTESAVGEFMLGSRPASEDLA